MCVCVLWWHLSCACYQTVEYKCLTKYFHNKWIPVLKVLLIFNSYFTWHPWLMCQKMSACIIVEWQKWQFIVLLRFSLIKNTFTLIKHFVLVVVVFSLILTWIKKKKKSIRFSFTRNTIPNSWSFINHISIEWKQRKRNIEKTFLWNEYCGTLKFTNHFLSHSCAAI